MIFVCAGQRRCGSLAMYQIMRELVVNRAAGFGDFQGRAINQEAGQWVKDKRVRVLKYHRFRKALYPYIDQIKVVMTVRDPRDTVISIMNRWGYPFDQALKSKEFVDNFIDYQDWLTKMPEINLKIVRYETLIDSRPRTIVEVGSFLGMDVSWQEAIYLASEWSIPANLARSKTEEGQDVANRNYVPVRHINDGSTNQWQSILTNEQAIAVEIAAGDWMKNHNYRSVQEITLC